MISERLERYVRSHHPERADEMLGALSDLVDELALTSGERVPLAVVLAAGVRRDGFEGALELARIDWRDVLVQGGLEHGDWRQKVDRILGEPGDQSTG